MDWIHKVKINVEVFLTVAACILFYFFIDRFDGIRDHFRQIYIILRPFLVGGVIAYLLAPICNTFEKRMKKTTSILASMILFLLVIFGFIAMLIPQLYDNLVLLVNAMPEYLTRCEHWLDVLKRTNPDIADYLYTQVDGMIHYLYQILHNDILPNMSSIIGGVKNGVSNALSLVKDFLIGLVIAVYLLNSRKTMLIQMKMLIYAVFPSSKAQELHENGKELIGDRILKECAVMHSYMGGFIKGKILDSLIIGLICLVVTWIAGIPYAVLVSVIVGVTNVIPFFGPFIGAIPSALLILVADPIKCAVFIVIVVVLQQLDGNVIGPKILGNAINLSTFWILFSILVFGGLFGLAGMILGVPIFGFLYHLLRDWIHTRPAVKNYLKEMK